MWSALMIRRLMLIALSATIHALTPPIPLRKPAAIAALRGGHTALTAAGPSPTPQEVLAPHLAEGAVGFEQIATIPRPGSQGLGMIQFSPDDKYVTYLGSLDATSLTRQLYAFDRTTGVATQVIDPSAESGAEGSFSREEELRRERARIMSTGITYYQWAARAERLLVPMDGALFVMDGVAPGVAPPRRLFDPADPRWGAVGSGPLLDPKLSADGRRVFFVWADEVCTCEVTDAADAAVPVRLTVGARGEGKSNGVADYCAQEEMDRYTGYWPSADGAWLAFEEVDERHIAPFQIARHEADPHQVEDFRYPFAGDPNPKVRLGAVEIGGSAEAAAVTWFDLSASFGEDFYLARVDWAGDGRSLLAQVGQSGRSIR